VKTTAASLLGNVRGKAKAEEERCQKQSVGLLLQRLSLADSIDLGRRGTPDSTEQKVC